MGSECIVCDLCGISRRAKPWECIYGPFPSVTPFGSLVSVPKLGKEYIEGKEEESQTT